MQHCSISVTQIYTDNGCVKKLVRSWQFISAIRSYILLTQLTKTVCLIVGYMVLVKCRWVIGQSASTHDPFYTWAVDPLFTLAQPLAISLLPYIAVRICVYNVHNGDTIHSKHATLVSIRSLPPPYTITTQTAVGVDSTGMHEIHVRSVYYPS